jgi:hypothetical protein
MTYFRDGCRCALCKRNPAGNQVMHGRSASRRAFGSTRAIALGICLVDQYELIDVFENRLANECAHILGAPRFGELLDELDDPPIDTNVLARLVAIAMREARRVASLAA